MKERRILITGAGGQIGIPLTRALIARYGAEACIASDIRPLIELDGQCLHVPLDILDEPAIRDTVQRHGITQIIHLAAILSASGEKYPEKTWDVNIGGLMHILQIARENNLGLFIPSSIAVYGGSYGRRCSGQDISLHPSTMYGVSKVTGEKLCEYYAHKFSLDIRSIRFPGVIGPETAPGGGTTDYAVHIFHKLLSTGRYTCPLRADTRLPMIYIEDAITAVVDLLSAPSDQISVRTGYNVQAMSFTPDELYAAIRAEMPHVQIDYAPDPVLQTIADSWPESLMDTEARADWGWNPNYSLHDIVVPMLSALRANKSIPLI